MRLDISARAPLPALRYHSDAERIVSHLSYVDLPS